LACPIAHIFVAQKVRSEGELGIKDFPAFVRGNSFNDIRYLGVISRRQTHIRRIKWQMAVAERNSFYKGMLMHSLLDRAREGFMVKNDIYRFGPKKGIDLRGPIIKLAEDLVLYDHVEIWQEIIPMFDVVDTEAVDLAVSKEDVGKWQQILKGYVSGKPQGDQLTKFIEVLARGMIKMPTRLLHLQAVMFEEAAINVAANPEFQQTILEFYEGIVSYLRAWPARPSGLKMNAR
jgi:hypothetical protein